MAGTSGLIVFKAMSDRTQAADNAYGLDYAFLLFLGLAGFSGLVLLTFRSTAAMGLLLILHLSIVAALFVTAPYGKFVHFVYRVFALLRFQVESHGAQPQGGHEPSSSARTVLRLPWAASRRGNLISADLQMS